MNPRYQNQQQMHQGYPPSIYHQPPQQHIQQQSQSLLNGQHGNNQTNGNASTDAQSQAASGGQGGQEMNLASVLHYLQSEWRRWERDRNEWEIERAEMRARIALLEGQRRSAENLKVDLLRRVKMLEFALRQERTKTVSTAGKASGIAPSRLVALQDEDRASVKDDKEGSGSEGSEEGTSDRPKANGSIAKPSTISGRAVPDTSAWKSIGTVLPRDPKSRARSREYLKQCLQEITYLTSPGALNPLPPRPPVSIDPGSPSDDKAELNAERPTKTLLDDPPHFTPETIEESKATNAKEKPKMKAEREPPLPPHSHLMAMENTARPPSSPAVRTMSLPNTESNEEESKPQQDEGSSQLLTAIYRPESKAAWREELRAANEKAEKVRAAKASSEPSDEEQLASLSLSTEDEEIKGESSDTSERVWATRRTLRSHLDIVRSVDFAHGPGVMLASGGDDNTVKVWAADHASIMHKSGKQKETEPIATYRGHGGPVTTVVVSSALSTIFSGSMDSTIRLWKLPAATTDPYSSYDASNAVQTLEGHSDIVWDLVLLPSSDLSSKNPKENRLVSASADGTIKLWALEDDKWSLKSSYTLDSVPTCLAVYSHEYGKVLVGLANGLVQLWDVEAGEELRSFGEVSENAQPNAILSHPTLPAIVTAHEDGRLRFFDVTSSTPTHTILAHPGAITSLALSPITPTCILTASVDCTLRLWDLGKKTSLQEFDGHRKRSDEGVCAVASHPELPYVASAGADGAVRIWSPV